MLRRPSLPVLFLHLCVATVGFLSRMRVFLFWLHAATCVVGLSFNGGVFTLQSTLSHPRLQTVSPSVFRSGWQIGDESCSQHGSHRERVQLTLYLRHLMRDTQRGKKHKGGRDGRQTGDGNLWREGHRKNRRKGQEGKQLVFSSLWLNNQKPNTWAQ